MNDTDPDGGNERIRRRTRAELRELILEAGYEVLVHDGLGLGTESLTYKRVFDHLDREHGVRVTRGSVHERIWNSQREFQLDVLARAAMWDGTATMSKTSQAVAQTLESADLSAAASRKDALKEAIRVGARVNLVASEEDDLWHLWEHVAAVVAVQAGSSHELDCVRRSVADSYRARTDSLVTFYRSMLEAFALRVRPDLGLRHDDAIRKFAMVVTALSEGSSLRRSHTADYDSSFDLPTGYEGGPEQWDLFALGFWALTRFFFVDADELPPDVPTS